MAQGLVISDDDSTTSGEDSSENETVRDETKPDRLTRRASQRLIKVYRIQTSVQEASDEEQELEETGLDLEKLLSRRTSGMELVIYIIGKKCI